MVADKLTAWENYLKFRLQLESGKIQDYSTLAHNIVSNYKENQLIWAELNYYRDNLKILGNHQVFEIHNKLQEFRDLTLIEKFKAYKALEKKINGITKQLSTQKPSEEHLKADREDRLKEALRYKQSLDQVMVEK